MHVMQLDLPERELRRLGERVEEDYTNAISEHGKRMERFRRFYQKFRNRVDPPRRGDGDKSNFSVPIVQWQMYQMWARMLDALLGDDAEIIAKPTGPSDQRNAPKVGRFLTWRMFQSMRITNDLAVFLFRLILFGRSHAYAPWKRDTFVIPGEGEQVWYDGPGFDPLWPDELVVPAEPDAKTIHDFSFVIRRYRVSPDQLLRGERAGIYRDIEKNFQSLVTLSEEKRREWDGEEIQREKDEAEGVTYEGGLARGNAIVVHEEYLRWRPLKGKADGTESNLGRRYLDEAQYVVRYIPDLHLPIGVQDLAALYPRMRDRRPFAEGALVRDGSYWSPGLGELLETLEDEASANHNLFTDAGEFSVGPVVFAKPGHAAANNETLKYEPFTIVTTEDPQGVNALQMKADMQYSIVKGQEVISIAERVTGITDQASGRTSDRPNQPRTAAGQIALLEAGNIRIKLNMSFLREDVAAIASRIWLLDSIYAPKAVFFRVTEEEAGGLFETQNGFGQMTAAERGSRYDFDIRFASSVWSRAAKKQDDLALYQIDVQNPLIATNPRALWLVTRRVHAAFGDDNFADLVPEPPDLGQPKNPREEWTLALQGEEFQVHPADNDDIHLLDHYRRVSAPTGAGEEEKDKDALNRMISHIMDHQRQKRTKMMMQALSAKLAESLATNTPESGGLQAPAPMPAGLADVHGAITEMLGGGGAA